MNCIPRKLWSKGEIARQLPFFESHQASAEIRNLLGLVTGVTPRAVSLIEKLLNIKERKYSSQEKKQLSNLANMITNHDGIRMGGVCVHNVIPVLIKDLTGYPVGRHKYH
jgi:hypothetical protein